jgi:2-amino-4-hydroxy-6-hydroxymethyldihydropteridine diphosphokinase
VNVPTPPVIVAIGSNLGDSEALVRSAIVRLQEFSAAPVKASSLWRTQPVDCPPGSPPFVNAVTILTALPDETPETLLAKLQRLEKEFGRRTKNVLNEPRLLDLDLIAFGDERRASPSLALPHPRAHLRRFVLAPLNELAPDLVLTGQNRTVRAILETLPGTEVAVRLA